MHSKAKLFKVAKSTSFQSGILIYSTKTFTWLYLKVPKNNNNQPLAPLMQWLASLAKAEGDFQSLPSRAIPRIFCQWGQTPQTFTGIYRIQTGFIVKHYVRKEISFPGGGNCPPAPPPPPLCTALPSLPLAPLDLNHSSTLFSHSWFPDFRVYSKRNL